MITIKILHFNFDECDAFIPFFVFWIITDSFNY